METVHLQCIEQIVILSMFHDSSYAIVIQPNYWKYRRPALSDKNHLLSNQAELSEPDPEPEPSDPSDPSEP